MRQLVCSIILFVVSFFCGVRSFAGDSPTSYMVDNNLRVVFPGSPSKFKSNGGYGHRYKTAAIEYTVDVLDSVRLDFSDQREMDSILKVAIDNYAKDPKLKRFQKKISDTVIGGAKGKIIVLVNNTGGNGYCRIMFFATIRDRNLYYLTTAQNDCSDSVNTLANYYFEDATFEGQPGFGGDKITVYKIDENLTVTFPDEPKPESIAGVKGFSADLGRIRFNAFGNKIQFGMADDKDRAEYLDKLTKEVIRRSKKDYPGMMAMDTVLNGMKGKYVIGLNPKTSASTNIFYCVMEDRVYLLEVLQKEISLETELKSDEFFASAKFYGKQRYTAKNFWMTAVLQFLRPLFVIAFVWIIIYFLIRRSKRK